MRALTPPADETFMHDGIVVMHSVRWRDYQNILRARGERSIPRVAYLEGELELMRPSRSHEGIRTLIGRLVEVWCEAHDLEHFPYGSWTLGRGDEQAGAEPDECFVFGEVARPKLPDLVIEVVWTSGGVNKLEIYRRLGVREVWIWEDRRISVYVLRGQKYAQVSRSQVLKGIDLDLLCSFLDRPSASRAKRDYRAALKRGAH